MKKFWKHKSKLAALALVLLVASVMLTLYTPVKAQVDQPTSGTLPAGASVNWTFTTYPRLSFTPNPIGVGQTLLVNLWVTPPPTADRFMKDYKVTITDPDGNEDVIVMDSYVADGTAWFPYVVDQAGTWTLRFDFQGMYFPKGWYNNGEYSETDPPGFGWTYYEGQYYKPASTGEQELVVQEEQVPSWPLTDLPTDYWERPISMEHREWAQIGGNYPWNELEMGSEWSGEPSYYGPYITAPNTSHIAWKVLRDVAGIHGGEPGVYGITGSVSTPDVIYAGRCYDTYYKPGVGQVAGCFDLRTGQIYYEIPTEEGGVTPQYIAYFRGGFGSVPGAEESFTTSVELVAIGGETVWIQTPYGMWPITAQDTLYKVDPFSGAVSSYNITGAGRILAYRNGHFLSIRDSGAVPEGNPTYLYNWTVQGSTNNFANRIVTNQSFLLVPSFRANVYNFYGRLGSADLNSGMTVITRRFYQDQVTGGGAIGVSLKDGTIKWNITFTDYSPFSPSTTVSSEGVYVCVFSAGVVRGYDIYTGKQLWENTDIDYPWGGFYGYDEAAAYGMAYFWSYSGVQAFDLEDGHMVWQYTAPAAPFETPYYNEDGVESLSFSGSGIVADGKVYTRNSEHTPTAPYTRGWGFHCIDAFTGEKIWAIAGAMNPGAAADGYITAGNTYDGYMYVFGKGKSATTISAPQTEIPLGESVMLTGTVLDQSPAQPGTPCVSKESIDTQMNYLHMQRPIDGLWGNETITGVPVSLDTVDPNGNFIHIGDVTTDGYSGTFGFMFTPEVPGTYTIMATFMGDESYGSSFAQTYVGVGEAPEEPVTPATEPEVQEDIDRAVEDLNSSLTPMFIGIIVAVAVAIVIGLVNLWALRKRQ